MKQRRTYNNNIRTYLSDWNLSITPPKSHKAIHNQIASLGHYTTATSDRLSFILEYPSVIISFNLHHHYMNERWAEDTYNNNTLSHKSTWCSSHGARVYCSQTIGFTPSSSEHNYIQKHRFWVEQRPKHEIKLPFWLIHAFYLKPAMFILVICR